MKTLVTFLALNFVFALGVFAADETKPNEVIKLWPNGVPDDWKIEKAETGEVGKDGVLRVKHVSEPTLSYFAPQGEHKSSMAVVICPGGGYSILAFNHEGTLVADFLAKRGFHAFVLKYRLPNRGKDPTRWHVALQDSQRAISLVRADAAVRGINPGKIGVMGFSAGGHLSAITSTRYDKRNYTATDDFDKQSCRPDFTGLIYPAYLVKDKKALDLNPEVVVNEKTPPAFFVQTTDDPIPVESTLAYYLALKRNKVPAQLHIYDKGPHGYGITKAKEKPVAAWPDRLAEWMSHLDNASAK